MNKQTTRELAAKFWDEQSEDEKIWLMIKNGYGEPFYPSRVSLREINDIYLSENPQTETKVEDVQVDDINGEPDKIRAILKENALLLQRNKELLEALQEINDFLHVLPMLRLANKQGFDDCIDIEKVKSLKVNVESAINQIPSK